MKQNVHPWNSPLVVFVVVFCLVLATGTLVASELNANTQRAPRANKLAFVKNWRELMIGHTRGDSSASVRVVVFADYQCPSCATLHGLLVHASDSLSSQLQIISRHFPLSGHTYARAAANAAECAAEQGRFAAFEDLAYQHQDEIGVKPWTEFAHRAGVLDSASFTRCITDGRHLPSVDRDRAVAQTLKFAGTPTYVVNGQPYFGAPSLTELMKQLRGEKTNAN